MNVSSVAVAAGSVGLAVALLVPARPTARPREADVRSARRPSRRLWLPSAALAAAGAVLLGLPAWPAVPVGITGAAIVALLSLWTRRTARVRRRAQEAVLVEVCQQLSSELRAGQPPGAALDHAASLWPALAPAAEAFRVGADVPDALRQAGERLQLRNLRLLAAAWQLASRTGQGLAAAVERVAGQLVSARATRRVVDGELASARATARLVAALPVVALTMGSGTGGDPLAFLVSTSAGWLCLGAGLTLGVAGLWWIEAIAADVEAAG